MRDNPNVEPGMEKPVERREPTATVGWDVVDDLPQEEFDKLASHLRARDMESMRPEDVKGIGTRRKFP